MSMRSSTTAKARAARSVAEDPWQRPAGTNSARRPAPRMWAITAAPRSRSRPLITTARRPWQTAADLDGCYSFRIPRPRSGGDRVDVSGFLVLGHRLGQALLV